jgi:hypothetical protein
MHEIHNCDIEYLSGTLCRLFLNSVHMLNKCNTEVTERRGRRRKKLLDDLKENKGYWKLYRNH